jgi:hypothetical protein
MQWRAQVGMAISLSSAAVALAALGMSPSDITVVLAAIVVATLGQGRGGQPHQ